MAILPARVRKPRDKAKVEAGVLVVERFILARLRNRTFFSLAELNAAIATLLGALNTRPFKKYDGCRRSRFIERDRPALRALPQRPYTFGEWRRAKVHPDYHVEVKRAYYSVPYRLIGQQLDVRLSAHTVEIYDRGQLVATHPRATERAQRSTRKADRPARHVAVIEQSLERVFARAATIGAATEAVLRRQAAQRKHPEETLRSAQGILRLAHDFHPRRARCCLSARTPDQELQLPYRAHAHRDPTSARRATTNARFKHHNLRGPKYFQ